MEDQKGIFFGGVMGDLGCLQKMEDLFDLDDLVFLICYVMEFIDVGKIFLKKLVVKLVVVVLEEFYNVLVEDVVCRENFEKLSVFQ